MAPEPTRWEIVGGATTGGLLVRIDSKAGSAKCTARLATGSIVLEVELMNERLHYKLESGNGPPEGWITTTLLDKVLAIRVDPKVVQKRKEWLEPSGSGDILLQPLPLKGHIVHLSRIAQWFAQTDYQVHVACFPEHVSLFPPSVNIHTLENEEEVLSGTGADEEEDFRRMAREASSHSASADMQNAALARRMAWQQEQVVPHDVLLTRFTLRVLREVMPRSLIMDVGLQGNRLVRDFCAMHEICLMYVQSPGIPESWQRRLTPEEEQTKKEQTEILAPLYIRAYGLPDSAKSLIDAMNNHRRTLAMIPWDQRKDSNTPLPEEMETLLEPLDAKKFSISLLTQLQDMDFVETSRSRWHAAIAAKLGFETKFIEDNFNALRKSPVFFDTIFPSSRALMDKIVQTQPAFTASRMCLFTGPFLSLPGEHKGSVQRNRTDFLSTLPPISQELFDWLYNDDESVPVVYMAFGSIVRPSEDLVTRLVEGLDNGPWKVLFVTPNEVKPFVPEGLSSQRWRFETFVPQFDILKCDRVKCFISHMGANSTVEALSCGVPLVSMPFFMDQYDWAKLVCDDRGAGVQVDKNASPTDIRSAVLKVLKAPHYQEAALECRRIMWTEQQLLLERLGPKMAPPSKSIGPGVSVVAAMVLADMKRQPTQYIYRKIVEDAAKVALQSC